MVRTPCPLQGSQVQSLVEELRSHMTHGVAEKKKVSPLPNTLRICIHPHFPKTICFHLRPS